MEQEHSAEKILVILVITNFLCWTFSSPDSEVSCLFMQSCILPCNLTNGHDLVLHWSYTEGQLHVHSFYHNQDQLGHQNQRFRNRTFLFKDQISRNNLSLLLTGVKLQDEGRYKCFKSSTSGSKETFINLKVDASVTVTTDETTLPCLGLNGSVKSVVWRFDHQMVLNQTGRNRSVSERWRKHVRDVSELGDLSLQGLDPDLEGKYSCETSDGHDTTVTQITVKRDDKSSWIIWLVIGIIFVIVMFLLCFYWKRRKSKTQSATNNE